MHKTVCSAKVYLLILLFCRICYNICNRHLLTDYGEKMYINSAYLNNSVIDRKDSSKPLIVTMCDYTRNKSYPLGVHVEDWIFSYFTSRRGRHIFILAMATKIPSFRQGIWFYIVPKNRKNTNIMG